MLGSRLRHEMRMFDNSPPEGISCWHSTDNNLELFADIAGPPDTVYSDGVWRLKITLTERYPIDPPKVVFVTPIYHPNIDTGGRICLDSLKREPEGSWTPILNLPKLLTMIRLLISNPNPNDPLMPDINTEYVRNRRLFDENALEYTKKYAIDGNDLEESLVHDKKESKLKDEDNKTKKVSKKRFSLSYNTNTEAVVPPLKQQKVKVKNSVCEEALDESKEDVKCKSIKRAVFIDVITKPEVEVKLSRGNNSVDIPSKKETLIRTKDGDKKSELNTTNVTTDETKPKTQKVEVLRRRKKKSSLSLKL